MLYDCEPDKYFFSRLQNVCKILWPLNYPLLQLIMLNLLVKVLKICLNSI